MEFTLPGDQEYGNRVGLASRISVKISRVLILLDQQRADELGHFQPRGRRKRLRPELLETVQESKEEAVQSPDTTLPCLS
jgi:hypothetical protein